MLDELLEIFERDRRPKRGQRRGTHDFFDRFNEDDDDERARRSHRRSHDHEYDEDDDWYDTDHRTRH